ncbi:hypothetical protein M3J07_012091 [Ascochyta lentis]
MDPFSAGMFASIGSAFKFADIAVRIAEVGSENAVFVRAIQIVRSDLEEVERLLIVTSVQARLAATPGKLPWVKTAINNTRCALNDIGKWVERARVEQETTGSVRFETRVRWIFNDHEKLVNRQAELSTCHQQLSNVLGYLVCMENLPTSPVPREYGSVDCFDDILSRHQRTSGPNRSNFRFDAINEGNDGESLDMATTGSVLAPHSRPISNPGTWSKRTMPLATIPDRRVSEPPSSLPPMTSPPGSPPPTYAVAVSSGRAQLNTYLGVLRPAMVRGHNSISQHADLKTVSSPENDHLWAYRANFNDVAVPELAGGSVSFSGTNSAGPVNPYEFCATPTASTSATYRGSQTTSEDLVEMLGDLHFRAELPNNEANPSSDNRSQVRARPGQTELSRLRYTQLGERTTSDMSPMLNRRPVPMNAVSDPLLTVNELPSSLAINTANMKLRKGEESTLSLPTLDSLTIEQPPHTVYRPPTASQPHTHTCENKNRALKSSPPPPSHPVFNQYAAAFSADSTSSWGLDTQPQPQSQTPSIRSPQHGPATTRMQRQKQTMDLLRSIGT